MHLYNLALVAPSNITAACVGQFSGTRTQEIAVCRAGARIELLRREMGPAPAGEPAPPPRPLPEARPAPLPQPLLDPFVDLPPWGDLG